MIRDKIHLLLPKNKANIKIFLNLIYIPNHIEGSVSKPTLNCLCWWLSNGIKINLIMLWIQIFHFAFFCCECFIDLILCLAQGLVEGAILCFRNLYFYFRHGESTSTASQLTSPASQKSKDLNKVLLLLQDLDQTPPQLFYFSE